MKFANKLDYEYFEDSYKFYFSENNKLLIKFLKNVPSEDFMNIINEIVNYGWRKEAIPVTHTKKSIITRFFDMLFN